MVPRQSWQRALWVLFPAILGWSLLLASLCLVVPRQSWQRALCMWLGAIPGSGLLLALVGLVV